MYRTLAYLYILISGSLANAYTPTSTESTFAESLKSQKFVAGATWTQKGSLYIGITHDANTKSSVYEQLAYGICADGKRYGLSKFTVHLVDARAMIAGVTKRLTDKVACN